MVTSLRSKWAAGKAVRAGLAVEGAYLNRYVTDEQRSRRPIFNATLRAAASWLFFRVARSTRMTQIWALRSRLEKQPTDQRRRHHYMRDGALAHFRAPDLWGSYESLHNRRSDAKPQKERKCWFALTRRLIGSPDDPVPDSSNAV